MPSPVTRSLPANHPIRQLTKNDVHLRQFFLPHELMRGEDQRGLLLVVFELYVLCNKIYQI